MKHIYTIILCTCMCSAFACQTNISSKYMEQIAFANKQKAQALLTTEDDYTQGWSAFDIESRLDKIGGTEEELLQLISDQAMDWEETEMKHIEKAMAYIEALCLDKGIELKIPDTLYLLKTTGKEEGNATAYTRQKYIVFSAPALQMKKKDLAQLILHELFHVLTRVDESFRQDMYQTIGFHVIPAITFPKSSKYSKISNPDAPFLDSYATFTIKGQPVDCMMFLYADREYTGGNFFEYVQIGFLKLEGEDHQTIALMDGEPVIYPLSEIENFSEMVGQNTNYIIDPEEVLAENFSFLILGKKDMPSPWILERIYEKL